VASTTGGNLGLEYGWTEGESGWKTGMDANLKALDALLSVSIIDRDLTAPPGGETDGDQYIVASVATGAWATHEDEIAVYVVSAYEFHIPQVGQLAYIEDEVLLCVFKAGGWSTGIAI